MLSIQEMRDLIEEEEEDSKKYPYYGGGYHNRGQAYNYPQPITREIPPKRDNKPSVAYLCTMNRHASCCSMYCGCPCHDAKKEAKDLCPACGADDKKWFKNGCRHDWHYDRKSEFDKKEFEIVNDMSMFD